MVNRTSLERVVPQAPAWSSLSLEAIRKELEPLGQPAYRSRQLFAAIHERGIWDWSELSEWPLSLRTAATDIRRLRALDLDLDVRSNRDSTNKVLFGVAGAGHIEAVLMKSGQSASSARYTVCISSQVGCPAGCSFCATGIGGFSRNLTTAEIVDQVEFFAGRLYSSGKSLHNVVYMGMGEPFLNYVRLMESISSLRSPSGLHLGARRITVSTVGIVPGIRRFAGDAGEVNLAVSLHAPTDELRSRLVPYNDRYPVGHLLEAVQEYIQATGRRVSFEYVLLKGTNDSPNLAVKLAGILKQYGQMAHVNLIPWNPFTDGHFVRSETPDAEAFKNVLRRHGINATIRYSKGLDIDAACGQLRDRVVDGRLAS